MPATMTVTLEDPRTVADPFPDAVFCRALYDYNATDSSSLSFKKNDVMEVVNRLETGWWDGFLDEVRGWFPSNFVVPISDEEAEERLYHKSLGKQPTGSPLSSKKIARTATTDSDDDWLHSDMDRSVSSNSTMSTSLLSTPEISDYWLPEMMPDGQILYVNSHTGEKSRDLPQEEGGDSIAAMDLSMLSTSTSSSNTSALAELSPTRVNHAGFGVPRHTQTPEPWLKKLADDGMSYYYVNKVTNETRWTLPQREAADHLRKRAGTMCDLPPTPSPKDDYPPRRNTDASRERSGSSVAHVRPLPRIAMAPSKSQASVYFEDSDLFRIDRERSNSRSSIDSVISDNTPAPPYQLRSSPELLQNMTSAERVDQVLQTALAPPPAEVITDLLATAREAITALLAQVRPGHTPPLPDEESMENLVTPIVFAVRNLIYVAAVSPPNISSSLLPRAAGERRNTTASQNMLKPPQRRVTATLAKLVLSARAIQYNSGTAALNAPSRIREDAEGLNAAVGAFVDEVERFMRAETHSRSGLKRVHGVFSTANIGLGLVGAGAAANWKGLGWLVLDEHEHEEAPGKLLSEEVVTELNSLAAQTQETFTLFQTAVSEQPDAQVIAASQDVVSQMSTLLVFMANIHVARHVDIDGIGREHAVTSDGGLYEQTLEKARMLVRTLEAAMQSLYDDGSTFLIRAQALTPGNDESRDFLDALSACMQSNLDLVCQNFGALLAIGHKQADLSQGDYSGSIEWRMSRLNKTPTQTEYSPSIVHLDGQAPVFTDGWATNGPGAESAKTLVIRTSSPLGTHEDQDADSFIDSPIAPKSPPRGEKLKKIFGNDAPRHYIETANADSKPWYLRPNYNQAEILIDPDGGVKGGTVPALVERLTAHEHGDPTFIKSFLMTYKSFTTLDEVFDLLVQRFRIQPPEGLNAKELEEWTKLKQHIIQMRVLNTFKSMVVDEDVLEKDDIYILDRMRSFITQEEVYQFAAAKVLLTLIERYPNKDGKGKSTAPAPSPPTPIQPKTSKRLKLLDIDPLELARQLTIMESRLYQAIKPIECLQRSRETKADHKDNITRVTRNFNWLANWVQECILSREDRRERANVIKYFINVAEKCRTLHNFSSMVAIVSGLNAVPVRRLKRSWEQVSSRLWAQMNTCEAIIDPNRNFTNYRTLLNATPPPCVPYIGVFLTTLTFVQEGSKDSLPDNLVNFRKRQRAAEVINDIKRWQSLPYVLHPIASVLVFIEGALNAYGDQPDVAERFWNTSMRLEPREIEELKMSKLLQASGFS